MWKRICSLLLIVCLLAGACPLSVAAEDAAAPAEICALFAGGTGTEADPLLIADTYQLNSIRQYPEGHYRLLNDVEFLDEDYAEGGNFYNDGMGWEPCDFAGMLDGAGHVIRNLQIRVVPAHGMDKVGLFATVSGTITDLGMVDGYISGSYLGYDYIHVGAFAGCGGTFIRCYNTCTVYGEKDVTEQHWYLRSYANVGGIAGYGGTFIDCYNSGTISAHTSQVSGYAISVAGGIVGYSDGEAIGCYNSGTIDAYSDCTNAEFSDEVAAAYAGGIVGNQYYGAVTQCYNQGAVTAKGYLSYGLYDSNRTSHASAGGIVGHMRGNKDDTIADCYNVGTVYADSKTDEYSGGIAGDLYGAIALTRCYNLGTVSSRFQYSAVPAGLVGSGGSHQVGSDYYTSYQLPVVTDCFYANTAAIGVNAYSRSNESQAKLLGTPFATTDELIALTADCFDCSTDGVWGIDPLNPTTPLILRNQMRTLQRIEIVSAPAEPLSAVETHRPDLSAVQVRATYTDGSTTVVPLSQWLLPDLDVNTVGTYVLAPTWNGITAEDTVTIVIYPRTALSLTITQSPATWVPLGTAEADLNGGTIEVVYDNGAVLSLPMSDATVSGFDGSVAGMQTLTVSYDGVSATYDVEVRDVRSIAVTRQPNKTAYVTGDTFDPAGMTMTYTLHDGTTRTLPVDEVTISPELITDPGRQNVTIRYCGAETTVPIVVHEGYSQPDVLLDPATYPSFIPDEEFTWWGEEPEPQTITYPGAAFICITFDEDTYTNYNSYWDNGELIYEEGAFIHVGGQDGLIGTYSGEEAAGLTLYIPGDSVTISLDGLGPMPYARYGFTSIVAGMRYTTEHESNNLPSGYASGSYDRDTTKTCTVPGAEELLITFEDNYFSYNLCSDQCYYAVLDGNNQEIFRHYGGNGGATVVSGNTFKVQHHHEGNDSYYGCDYKVESVQILTTILHPAEAIPDVAPTCTTRGQQGGQQCAVCQMVMTAPTYLNATGHAMVRHEAQAPTCTEIGWDAYTTCNRCDYNTYREQAAIGHSYVSDALVCDHCGVSRTIEELVWDTIPHKQEYARRLDALDVSGGRLRVTYSDGVVEYVDMTDAMVVDFDPTAFGEQTLTVLWCGTSVSYSVTFVSTYLPGDVNGDGKVNVRDLGWLQQHLNGWDVNVTVPFADVNADGNINVRDLGMLQQYLNGWKVELV